ncbi:MAG: hypothetical protein EHM64_13945 [Ignavibacteriae bacterium]|nr:MAG: hypothetical protein EHM64_13945 [Ignavibacteriota bacterium]
MKLRVVNKPAKMNLGKVATTTSVKVDGIMMFANTLAEVDAKSAPIIEAAKADRIAWIAYPKAGQLGTDLNRDILWNHMLKKGVQGIRQIALDDIWSAMRFRPGK